MQEHREQINPELAARLGVEGVSARIFCSLAGIGDPTLIRDYRNYFSLNEYGRIPLEDAQRLAKRIEDDRANKLLSRRRKPLDEGLLPHWQILIDQP